LLKYDKVVDQRGDEVLGIPPFQLSSDRKWFKVKIDTATVRGLNGPAQHRSLTVVGVPIERRLSQIMALPVQAQLSCRAQGFRK
jgi:hypothetical protein